MAVILNSKNKIEPPFQINLNRHFQVLSFLEKVNA